MRRALDWLDDRTGYRAVVARALDETVPGGASFAYVGGSVLVFLFALQAVTGVMLAFYYSPSASDAWASVAYIEDQVTMGWFVRGLHHHGASAMVIVAGLHMLQTALYGAYKKPREVNWIVGVLMLGLILSFALTGYLLPWDQTGYWATKVATGIAGTTPLIGEQLQQALQGGNEYGTLTVTRFFALHVFVLPGLLVPMIALHLALFRRHGVTPRWGRSESELARCAQPFWPDQLFRDMVAVAVVFAVLVGVNVATHGAGVDAPADPASSFDARPEWYFRPLFQLLKYFHGPLETIAALGLPVVVGGALLALPFLDRADERDPRRRLPFLGAVGLGVVAAAALTLVSLHEDANDPQLRQRIAAAEARAAQARALARQQGVPVEGAAAVFATAPHYEARALWAEHCAGCHEGDARKGPEIVAGYNSRAWIAAFLRDPGGERFFGVTQINKMKPVTLQGVDFDAVVEIVYAQTGAQDVDPELVARGLDYVENEKCSDCHSIDWETEGELGPNLGRRGSVEMLEQLIANPAHPRWFGARNQMPPFAGKLSSSQLRALAEYVASLRDTPAAR